jgi:hypothetical protein
MSANQARFPVETMARVLGVSKAGYYAWRHRSPSAHAQADAALLERIRAVHTASRETYGAPRVHAALRAGGERHSRKRVERLMREADLVGASHRRGDPVTTRRNDDARPAPDLVDRDFSAAGPNRLWVSDITFIPTAAGFLCLAIVLDAWSRKVVGWAMANHLRAELVLDALAMAVGQRRPKDVVHHSDQGSQGGFKWSSQHLDEGGCDGHTEAALGPGIARRVALAGAAGGGTARGSAAVLGGDRGGSVERGCSGRGGRVAGGGGTVVPGGGRHATSGACAISEAAIGAASVVR